ITEIGAAFQMPPLLVLLPCLDILVSQHRLGEYVMAVVESRPEQLAPQTRDIRLFTDQGLVDARPFDLADQDQTNKPVSVEDQFSVGLPTQFGEDFDAIPRQSLYISDRYDWQTT